MEEARRTMRLSRDDERLKRDSPAYRPDDNWDELERQAMDVVVSVRFDASTMQGLYEVARRAHRTPGQLIRQWTVERLASASGEPLAAGISEEAARYDAADQHEALRQRYRPDRIDILMVGESRPAGGSFFYRANSNLYDATRQAVQRATGPVPQGSAFLELLKDRGVWLYDLADTPVNRPRGRPRRDAVLARIAELVRLLEDAKPRLVVAIKKDLGPSVAEALREAGLDADRLRVLPFPLYQWRNEYVQGLAEIFKRSEGDDATGIRRLRDALEASAGVAPYLEEGAKYVDRIRGPSGPREEDEE